MAADRGFDLAQLDAVAADLDLLIGPADVLEAAIGAVAHQVSGPVHPWKGGWGLGAGGSIPRRCSGKRIRHEPLPGEPLIAEVSARQADSADKELASDANRNPLAPLVEDVGAKPRNRVADRRRTGIIGIATRVGGEIGDGRDDRRFGRAVGIEQADAVADHAGPARHRRGQRLFAADDQRGEPAAARARPASSICEVSVCQ